MKVTRIIKLIIVVFSVVVFSIQADEGKESKQVFFDALKSLKNAESYEVQGKIIYSINSNDTSKKASEIEQKFKVITKGDKLNFLSLDTQQGNIQVFRNGSGLTIYSDKDKRYIERDAPGNINLFMLIGAPNFLDSIVFGDLEQISSLTIKQVTPPTDNQTEKKEKQFQIQVDNNDEVNMWFSMESEPKITRVQSEIPATQVSSGGTMNIYFDDWKVNSVTDESVFKFNPPAGASKAGKEMVGEKAPEFTLPTLDGEKVSLKDFHGKKVVVLDFWASWCGPCRMAMPAIQDVSKELKDKEVVFFAVNLGEEKEKITSFLKKIGISIPVLMDKDGGVADLYRVKSIPRLVVIGKDGFIKSGHTGFSAEMKEELKKEILEALK